MWLKSDEQKIYINLDHVLSINMYYKEERNSILGGYVTHYGIKFNIGKRDNLVDPIYRVGKKDKQYRQPLINSILSMMHDGVDICDLDILLDKIKVDHMVLHKNSTDNSHIKHYATPIIKRI